MSAFTSLPKNERIQKSNEIKTSEIRLNFI